MRHEDQDQCISEAAIRIFLRARRDFPARLFLTDLTPFSLPKDGLIDAVEGANPQL